MTKLAKFTALSLTAGILLTACGDGEDTGEDVPGIEDPATEDDGMDDGLEDDGLEDDMDD